MNETDFKIITNASPTETKFINIKLNISNDNYMAYRNLNSNTSL